MKADNEIVRRTEKVSYSRYICDFCGILYVTANRKRKADNCGCHGNATTHGEERKGRLSPELKTFRKMQERCLSIACRDYINYGGRGITICPKWRNSFPQFLADIGRRPGHGYSLERDNVNGNYEPSNCRWATKKEQANNTRRNRPITYNGQTENLCYWLETYGLSKTQFYRNAKTGISDEANLASMMRGIKWPGKSA